MTLSHHALETINLELTTTVQEMDQSIRNGKQYNGDTLKHLEALRGAIVETRRALKGTPMLRVVA
jgi:hypothetical protein